LVDDGDAVIVKSGSGVSLRPSFLLLGNSILKGW